MFHNKYSLISILVIFLIFSTKFSQKIQQVQTKQDTCLCAYDGFGYYMYLPHLFQTGQLNMKPDWAKKLQDSYCPGVGVYQLLPQTNGNYVDLYHMGLAFIQLPAYILGDQFAKLFGYQQDGFSTPYFIAYLLNVLLFIALGLYYLRKLLLLFFTDKITALTILLLYLASNIYITFTQQYDLPHLYLFALNALLLYHLFKYMANKKQTHLLLAALVFGLTTCIRPTQAIWGIIPLLLLFQEYKFSQLFWRKLLLFPLFAVLWNIPQLLYWYFIGGKLLMHNLHTEEIILIDPNLFKFLFSFKKGWLLYSPIFILALVGFRSLYRKNKQLAGPLLICLVLSIYVLSSWECWWYAASYGQRVLVDYYPLLAIPLASMLMALCRSTFRIIIGILFTSSCIILNVVQSYQFYRGYVHLDRMTKNHYNYVFGRIDIPNYTEKHLEINRSNTNWPSEVTEDALYSMEEKRIFNLTSPLIVQPKHDLGIGRINLLEKLKTDETLLEVRITCKTSDSTKSSLLRLETISKYNCYSWDNFEVSLGYPSNESYEVIYRFNLPPLRHQKDQLQIYLNNPNEVQIKIESLSIKGYSLIRK
jgi:hypothetical protein